MDALSNILVTIVLAAAIGVGIAYAIGRDRWESTARKSLAILVGVLVAGGSYWLIGTSEKLETTAQGVVLSIVASALLFIGANKFFDLAPRHWTVYTTLLGGGAVSLTFAVLWGNRAIDDPVARTMVATVVGLGAGYLLGAVEHQWRRLAIGVGAGALLGGLAASGMRKVVLVFDVAGGQFELWPVLPNINFGELLVYTFGGMAIGALFWQVRGRRGQPARPLTLWATLGFFLGAWVLPRLGTGTKEEAIVASIGMGVGLGALAGLTTVPDAHARGQLESRSRAYVFLVPALTFIGATLVIPTIRTVYLSFYDTRGREFVGLANYGDIFTSRNIFDTRGWRNIFGSSLFQIGVTLLLVGLLIAIVAGRRRGDRIANSAGTVGTSSFGVFLIVFAIFASLRGTIFNNLWWVFTVTIVAAVAGLGVAVLADRAKYESAAKSLIFMPMAISFVGAGVIWRFMYQARDVSREQTGVLNSLWVSLGRLSNSGTARNIVVAILLAIAAGAILLAYRAWRAEERSIAAAAGVFALPVIWFAYALVRGVGGFVITESGEVVADTILFVQEGPFNNIWLMLVLIWIQTGFTMVIFSAAIKAVPTDLIEAAEVDGATEAQTFWRVIIPQIAPTIGVVVTTLVVLVMKVFDIVKVMTNGNFNTQVIANEMWQRAFTELNFGLGSALAVVLFIAILPILYSNIRRMQRAVI